MHFRLTHDGELHDSVGHSSVSARNRIPSGFRLDNFQNKNWSPTARNQDPGRSSPRYYYRRSARRVDDRSPTHTHDARRRDRYNIGDERFIDNSEHRFTSRPDIYRRGRQDFEDFSSFRRMYSSPFRHHHRGDRWDCDKRIFTRPVVQIGKHQILQLRYSILISL